MNQAEMKRRQIESLSGMLGMAALLFLGSCMGENGLAYYAAAYEFFFLIWSLVGSCVSNTLGRMLREKNARSQYRNVIQMRKLIMMFQGGVGLAASVAAALSGGFLVEHVFHVPHGSFITLVLAPMLFFRTVSAVLSGYFQGGGSEFPTVAAGLLRPVLFMGFGLLFGNLLQGYGEKVSALYGQQEFTDMYSAIGVAVAALLTEILLFLFLLILYRSNRGLLGGEQTGMRTNMRTTDPPGSVLRAFYGRMSSFIGMRLLERLPVWFGLVLLEKCVLTAGGTVAVYGIYYGKYIALTGAFLLLIDALIVPDSVKVQVYIRRDDQRSAASVFQAGLHAVSVYGVFFSVFMGIMGRFVADVFCKSSVDIAGKMFCYGSFVVLFAGAACFFSRNLILSGKRALVLVSLCLMNLAFIIAMLLFMNVGNAGILAYVYAGLIASVVLCAVMGGLACYVLGMGIDWIQTLLVPSGCACVTGLFSMLLGELITPHLGSAVTLFLCLAVAWILYFVMLVLLRNFRETELKNLPGGVWIRILGQMLRVYS